MNSSEDIRPFNPYLLKKYSRAAGVFNQFTNVDAISSDWSSERESRDYPWPSLLACPAAVITQHHKLLNRVNNGYLPSV